MNSEPFATRPKLCELNDRDVNIINDPSAALSRPLLRPGTSPSGRVKYQTQRFFVRSGFVLQNETHFSAGFRSSSRMQVSQFVHDLSCGRVAVIGAPAQALVSYSRDVVCHVGS